MTSPFALLILFSLFPFAALQGADKFGVFALAQIPLVLAGLIVALMLVRRIRRTSRRSWAAPAFVYLPVLLIAYAGLNFATNSFALKYCQVEFGVQFQREHPTASAFGKMMTDPQSISRERLTSTFGDPTERIRCKPAELPQSLQGRIFTVSGKPIEEEGAEEIEIWRYAERDWASLIVFDAATTRVLAAQNGRGEFGRRDTMKSPSTLRGR